MPASSLFHAGNTACIEWATNGGGIWSAVDASMHL
jgi:hypothetical protein